MSRCPLGHPELPASSMPSPAPPVTHSSALMSVCSTASPEGSCYWLKAVDSQMPSILIRREKSACSEEDACAGGASLWLVGLQFPSGASQPRTLGPASLRLRTFPSPPTLVLPAAGTRQPLFTLLSIFPPGPWLSCPCAFLALGTGRISAFFIMCSTQRSQAHLGSTCKSMQMS